MTTRAFEYGIVYILRFHEPLGNPDKKRGMAQYYVGWVFGPKQLKRRLREHKAGRGAKITRAWAKRGIGFDLVVTFVGTRQHERRVKDYKNTRLFVERRGWERFIPKRIPF